MSDPVLLRWTEAGQTHSARWQSAAGAAAPKKIQLADDRLSADSAFRLASEGTALLWRGDFQNARQLLQAMARRIDRKARKPGGTPAEAFHLHRQAQSQRARTLAMLLIEVNTDYTIPLRRAPDVRLACGEAFGPPADGFILTLRELTALIGAHEWRKKGVAIAALDARIHPHYGVFSPVRGEYIDLVAQAPLPATTLAFDIGTGTGVLAALLARRGVQRIVATEQDARAIACAQDNLNRLGHADCVDIQRVDLFPDGRAPLIVCNPPWVPARPSSPIEYAVFDPDSRMLRGFLQGLATHLTPGGEGWLILSDFAEHLGLRTRAQLLEWITAAGLRVLGRSDVWPVHPKSTDATDPLHAARREEITSLWRLGVAA